MGKKQRLLAIGVGVWAACGAPAERATSDTHTPLEGVWRLITTEAVGPDGTVFPGQAQESFLLFSGDYYSMNWAGGEAPAEPSVEPLRPSDSEKLARYNTLIVNAGRFTASDGVLTITPDFALVPEYVGGLGTLDYEVRGDTLDLEWHTIETVDGTPDPATAAGVRFHYKWVRR